MCVCVCVFVCVCVCVCVSVVALESEVNGCEVLSPRLWVAKSLVWVLRNHDDEQGTIQNTTI